MKTITYAQLLNKAVELAGRTRDKILLSEAAMLRGFFDTELRSIWNTQIWSDLRVDPEAMTPTARVLSRREGASNEIGDILGIYTGNPLTHTVWRDVAWEEGNNTFTVAGDVATVWVEYLKPCPSLDSVADADLPAYAVPAVFVPYLAYKGAGELLATENDTLSARRIGQAEEKLEEAMMRNVVPERLRRMRIRTARPAFSSVM